MIPIHSIVNVSEDPPKLTKGMGMPVTGMRPVTAAMFMSACVTIIAVSPPARRRPNVSRVPSAMRTPA